MSKRNFLVFGLILLVGFLILPGNSLAVELDGVDLRTLGKNLKLPESKVQSFIHSLIKVFHKEFEKIITEREYSPPYPTPEERVLPSIMKKVVQVQALNHLLTDAPFQVTWGIVKNAVKIASLIGMQNISEIVSELEKESVKRATEYGMNFLLENEIRVVPGAIDFEYTSKKGNKKTAPLQYIMIYKPSGGNRGEVLIRFYSPEPVEPPESRGSIGGAWGAPIDLAHNLPPFIVDIRGNVEDFKWVGSPSVDIDFPANVPDLGIKPLGFWERNVLKPIITRIKDVEVVITKIVGDKPAKIAGNLTDKLYEIVGNIWDSITSRILQRVTLPGGAGVGQQVLEVAPRSEAERAEIVQRFDLRTIQEQEALDEVGQEQDLNESFESGVGDPKPPSLAELQRQVDEAAKMVEVLNLQVLALLDAQEEQDEEVEEQEELDEWEEEDYLAEKVGDICQVNINTASAEELQKITGVGPVISQRIIEARPFYSLKDLETKVKGIGPKTIQKIISQGCAYSVSSGAPSSSSSEQEEEQEEEEGTFTANVVVNEIAWMGTATSSSDEWIELHNTTKSEVDLTGWNLVSADGSPNITFATGTIPALGFYLLERTSSTTTDVAEDQIYTGALNNNPNCEVLTLYDQNNNEIDKTVCLGSGDWPAGDNTAKTTMERIDPRVSGKNSSNWQNNNGITINGLDADGNQIKGTPRAQNSAYQTLAPNKVEDFAIDTQNSYSNKASLTWATSTDSDTLSENLSYKIYYSKTAELTESNLDAASTTTATTTQTSLTNLDYSSTYYFGIKAFDPENNFSELATTTSYKTATLATIASGFPSNLGGSDVPHNGRNIVRTSNGNLYAVYDRSGSAHKVFLASSTDDGITWSEAEITSDQDQIDPSIAIDSQDNLHIAWQGVGTSTVYKIRYTKYDGSSFSAIEDFTADSDKNQEIPVIAADSQNKIHLAWVGRGAVASSTGDSLYYVKKESGSWGSTETVKTGEFHSTFGKSSLNQFSLTPDNDDILHFVWFEKPPTDATKLRYRKVDPSIDPGTWGAREDLTNVSNPTQSSIAVDSQNNLHIVWHQPSSGNSIIKYLKCSASYNAGDIEELDTETNNLVVAHPSVAVDSNDNIYVVWKRWTTKPLSQIEYKNGAWQDVKDLIDDFPSQGFPNLLWSINSQPKTGYAFVFYEGTELKFYGSNDLTWE